jgi:2-amino-4-hydroxy-6-hydroxymethyldihydropteridine diphosphokinase
MTRAFLSIGSNLGDPLDNVLTAIGHVLSSDGITPDRIGSVYDTEPVGGRADQDWYTNTALSINTSLDVESLFLRCKEIEREMGRKMGTEERWGPRVIDIDIIFFGDRVVETPALTIPHVEAINRRFVLQPIADIDASFVHPINGKSVGQLLLELPDNGPQVRKNGP